MGEINLSDDTQYQVREYFYSTRHSLEEQKEMDKFLSLISPSLKQKIAIVIFEEPLTNNSLVKSMQK
jgi:hypothetical protein